MANWCFTEIILYSTDKEELSKFQKEILYAINKLPCEDGESKNWQGRISRYLNSSASGERSFIYNIDDVIYENDNCPRLYYFSIEQEDAWAPHINMWDELLSEQKRNIYFVYRAEAPSCDIYINSDVDGFFFPEKFYLNCDGDINYFTKESSLLAKILPPYNEYNVLAL